MTLELVKYTCLCLAIGASIVGNVKGKQYVAAGCGVIAAVLVIGDYVVSHHMSH